MLEGMLTGVHGGVSHIAIASHFHAFGLPRAWVAFVIAVKAIW